MAFKLKDVCTLFNILLSIYAILLLFRGELELAAWVIFIAWFTDGLDGLIARWTKTGNEFGVHFDNQADLFIYTIAPAFFAYAVYAGYSPVLGMALCFTVITAGCIRLARFNVRPLIYPGFWIGYPRPGLGLYIIFLLNSKFFELYQPYLAGAATIVVLAALNLSYIPYRNNKTTFTGFERFVCRLVWCTIPLSIFFGYPWDVGLFWSAIYAILPFTPLYSKYNAPIRRYVQEWKTATR
jgi:CDP-diacylglycerol---serine O-phosphatidyltransferase